MGGFTCGDLRASTQPLGFDRMRDRETIDSELRLLVAVRRVCREYDRRVPTISPFLLRACRILLCVCVIHKDLCLVERASV